jgi:hypothetical protein
MAMLLSRVARGHADEDVAMLCKDDILTGQIIGGLNKSYGSDLLSAIA